MLVYTPFSSSSWGLSTEISSEYEIELSSAMLRDDVGVVTVDDKRSYCLSVMIDSFRGNSYFISSIRDSRGEGKGGERNWSIACHEYQMWVY